MSTSPRYVARIARLPQVFEQLARHPEGLALETLAADFGTTVAELREDLLAFYTADLGTEWLSARPDVLEFLGPEGTAVDPGTAGIVRIAADGPADLGVEYVDAGELGHVYTAALALLDIEPGNTELADAIDVLAETMFGEPEAAGAAVVPDWNRLLPQLQRAREQRRAVRIVYSRAWHPGVSEREIEPYHLVQTRRGWEVDAGPVGADGSLRTYLLSNIRSAEVLERTFEVPADVEELLAAQRATTRVKVVLPQSARWVADFYAERVTFVRDDHEHAEVDLELLPPVGPRVGRLLLVAGPDAFVVDPPALQAEAAAAAEELIAHHRGTVGGAE